MSSSESLHLRGASVKKDSCLSGNVLYTWINCEIGLGGRFELSAGREREDCDKMGKRPWSTLFFWLMFLLKCFWLVFLLQCFWLMFNTPIFLVDANSLMFLVNVYT